MYKKPYGKLGKITYNSPTPWQNVDDLPEEDIEGESEEEELEDPLDVLEDLEGRLEELEEQVARCLTILTKKSETCPSSPMCSSSNSLSKSPKISPPPGSPTKDGD